MTTLPYPVHLFDHECPCAARKPDDLDPLSFRAQMHLCPACGHKRCPGAVDHTRACSGSNEPGQQGSFYEQREP
jgi:hypothetical protein